MLHGAGDWPVRTGFEDDPRANDSFHVNRTIRQRNRRPASVSGVTEREARRRVAEYRRNRL